MQYCFEDIDNGDPMLRAGIWHLLILHSELLSTEYSIQLIVSPQVPCVNVGHPLQCSYWHAREQVHGIYFELKYSMNNGPRWIFVLLLELKLLVCMRRVSAD